MFFLYGELASNDVEMEAQQSLLLQLILYNGTNKVTGLLIWKSY